jgi:hypothetical protein
MERKCCNAACDEEAEFEVVDSNERRPEMSSTDACSLHVGEMCSSHHPSTPTGPWIVHRITD